MAFIYNAVPAKMTDVAILARRDDMPIAQIIFGILRFKKEKKPVLSLIADKTISY
jgi:hypothetical protein